MSNLLFEIGTEEIPAGYIGPALSQLSENFSSLAESMRISCGDIRIMGTPRRLTLVVENLADRQDDIREEIVGPSVKAGLDADGNPTKAAMGFARSKGAQPEDLKKVETEKGEYLVLEREVKGKNSTELLPDILKKLIGDLSFPKSMKWGSNQLTFARPIQWLVAMLDSNVLEIEYEGIVASNFTMGHRFLHNEKVEITTIDSYEDTLAGAHVIVDQKKRRDLVIATVNEAVAKSETLSNGQVFIDEELVDTITNLVEIPYGICGTFDEKFLSIPSDALITSMKEHQKYFPVVDTEGNLLAGFVAVNNTKVFDDDVTRKGHQRVLRARLEDALFFFNGDKNTKLEDHVNALGGIIFQAKLGTMLEKSERIIKLSRILCEMVEPEIVEDCCRAAKLCKADLLTDMVGEFPSLQGAMGHAYALIEGEKDSVALAIREHYMPKRAGADLPSDVIGAIVGLADRFDTLAGCFGIGQIPSGTADPFGLRRISLAILHIVQERNYSLSLKEVVLKALALYGDKVDGSAKTVESVVQFIEGRYRNDCVANGLDSEAVKAATSVSFDDVIDCSQRIEALSKIKGEDDFSVLASSYKRIRNIIKDNQDILVDESLLVEDAEKELFKLLMEVKKEITPLLAKQAYSDALQSLLKMKEPVDLFFDKVMVMAEDPEVRKNRLNLLTSLGEQVLQVGDISLMHEG